MGLVTSGSRGDQKQPCVFAPPKEIGRRTLRLAGLYQGGGGRLWANSSSKWRKCARTPLGLFSANAGLGKMMRAGANLRVWCTVARETRASQQRRGRQDGPAHAWNTAMFQAYAARLCAEGKTRLVRPSNALYCSGVGGEGSQRFQRKLVLRLHACL